jgi:hypothetical protein
MNARSGPVCGRRRPPLPHAVARAAFSRLRRGSPCGKVRAHAGAGRDMKIRGLGRRPTSTPARERQAVERTRSPVRAVSPRVRQHVTRLVVEVANRATSWREAADDAQLAYRWWTSAPVEQRGDAAAVYLAAIEREEKAAAEYSWAVAICDTTMPDAACRAR